MPTLWGVEYKKSYLNPNYLIPNNKTNLTFILHNVTKFLSSGNMWTNFKLWGVSMHDPWVIKFQIIMSAIKYHICKKKSKTKHKQSNSLHTFQFLKVLTFRKYDNYFYILQGKTGLSNKRFIWEIIPSPNPPRPFTLISFFSPNPHWILTIPFSTRHFFSLKYILFFERRTFISLQSFSPVKSTYLCMQCGGITGLPNI